MKKTATFLVLILIIGTFSACSNASDQADLQAQIDELRLSVEQAESNNLQGYKETISELTKELEEANARIDELENELRIALEENDKGFASEQAVEPAGQTSDTDKPASESSRAISGQPSANRVINNVNVAKLTELEYVTLGSYELAEGDVIQYDVKASGSGNLSLGFVKAGVDPANTNDRYFITFNYGNNDTNTSYGPIKKDECGSYTLYVCNISGKELTDIQGTVIIEK